MSECEGVIDDISVPISLWTCLYIVTQKSASLFMSAQSLTKVWVEEFQHTLYSKGLKKSSSRKEVIAANMNSQCIAPS